MRNTLPLYDIGFTSNIHDHDRLSNKTSPRSELTFLGYDHQRFDDSPLPPHLAEKWANTLLFVGHHEPQTEEWIMALIEADLPVTVYGYGWDRVRNRAQLRGHVQFRELDNQEYVYALKGAKVGLCFVSASNANQTAGRSFETPACGTFLLAVRTRGHLECFEEGQEAAFFEDTRELVEKARFYLENEELRCEIARRGRERCVSSGYSWAEYMEKDWGKVVETFTKRKSWN